jgi:hypothetical protein
MSWSEEKTLEKYISEQNSTVQSAITNAINTQTSTIKGYTDAIASTLSSGQVTNIPTFYNNLIAYLDRNYSYNVNTVNANVSVKWPFKSYQVSSISGDSSITFTGNGLCCIYTNSSGWPDSISVNNQGGHIPTYCTANPSTGEYVYRVPFINSLTVSSKSGQGVFFSVFYC